MQKCRLSGGPAQTSIQRFADLRAFGESDKEDAESDAATSAPQTTSSEEVLLIDASEDEVDEDWSALASQCNTLTAGTAIFTCKHASPALLALTINRLPLKDFDRRCGLPAETAVATQIMQSPHTIGEGVRASLRFSKGLSNPLLSKVVDAI